MIVRCVRTEVENGMFVEGAKYFAINQGRTIHVYDELGHYRVICHDGMKFCVMNSRQNPNFPTSTSLTIPEYAYFQIEEY